MKKSFKKGPHHFGGFGGLGRSPDLNFLFAMLGGLGGMEEMDEMEEMHGGEGGGFIHHHHHTLHPHIPHSHHDYDDEEEEEDNVYRINDRRQLLWLDNSVQSQENQDLISIIKSELPNFSILEAETIPQAIDILKKIEFELVYIIVSGRFFEPFIAEYKKNENELFIIPYIIIYCYRINNYLGKPLVNDKFYNCGGITTEFKEVLKKLQKDEYHWYKVDSVQPREEEIYPETSGNMFKYVDSGINFSIIQILGNLMAVGEEYFKKLPEFQRHIIKYGNKFLSKLAKPDMEKNIEIPPSLFGKFFLKLYSVSTPLYKRMNAYLCSKESIGIYAPFIYCVYRGIFEHVLKCCYEIDLFRATSINVDELSLIKKLLIRKQLNEDNELNFNLVVYYTKRFLSFTKNLDVAMEFLKKEKEDNNNRYVPVLFIVKKCPNVKGMITNIDMEDYSEFPDEEEVLFLPLSSFEVVEVRQMNGYCQIILEHIGKYIEDIEKFSTSIESMETLRFYEDATKTPIGEEIGKFIERKSFSHEVSNSMSPLSKIESPISRKLKWQIIDNK